MNHPGGENYIRLEKLGFSYDPRSAWGIREFTASFGPSSLTFIIGPNGSGKSTLARIMIGYLGNFSGTVTIDGDVLRTLTVLETARRVAFVPQENPVTAPLTVYDAVELGRFCRLAGGIHGDEEDRRAIEEAIELTGIGYLTEKRIDNISGGEKQRVMIARALAQGAGNIILDEPTANLDLKFQPLIFDLLRRLVDRKHYNVIAISHDVNLASRYADHVLLLKDGSIFAEGGPSDIVRIDILEEAYETKLHLVGEGFIAPYGPDGGTGE